MKDCMSKIHLELLNNDRLAVFKLLSEFKDVGYLAGGTGLALQINHRKSDDFDIFVNHAIDNKLRLKVQKIFGKIVYYVNSEDQISFKTKNGINITFLWYYFKPLFPLIETEDLPLASIYDIALDKAVTIGRRAVWRDYVDIFSLLQNKLMTIEKIIKLAKKKFGNEFVENQFLEQLSFFGDIKQVPVNYVNRPYSFTEIKTFLEKQISSYTAKFLKG